MHKKHAPEGDDGDNDGDSADNGLAAALLAAGDPKAVPAASVQEGTDNCYLCHPGQQIQCLRDVMYQQGMTCTNCHDGTADVANPARQPWIDEPRCGNCHGP